MAIPVDGLTPDFTIGTVEEVQPKFVSRTILVETAIDKIVQPMVANSL